MKKSLRNRYHLTQSGLALLKEKLQALESERKKQISRLRQLRSQQSTGLLAEDSICIQTMSSIQFIESEMERLKSTLANAQVIKAVRHRRVTLGSSVKLHSSDGNEITYTLVDSVEADPFNGKISLESPLGRILVGKKLKDFIKMPSKRNSRSMQLIGIE